MAAMSDEESVRGWLPPHAPGAQPPPRFEPAPPEPEPAPPAASSWQPPSTTPQQAEDRYWGPPPTPRPPAAAGPPPAPPAARAAGGDGLAIAAIILGVISIAFLLLSLGTGFPFAILMSGATWAVGARAQRRAPQPGGAARTAVVIGMVGVGLSVAALVVWIVLLSTGFSYDDLRDWLERKLQEQRR
jgi:hypothetical protein